MVKHGRTKYTEQEIQNFALDNISVNPPTSMRAGLSWAQGLGWLKNPVMLQPRMKVDYSGGDNPIYVGLNADTAAADGDTDWVIFKFAWTGTNIDQSQMLPGSWTGRAALGWAF